MKTRLKINDGVDIEFEGYRIIGTLEGATYVDNHYKHPIPDNTDLSTLKFEKDDGIFIAGEDIFYSQCNRGDYSLVFCKPDSNGDLKPIGVLITNDKNFSASFVKTSKVFEEAEEKLREEEIAEHTDSESDSELDSDVEEDPDKGLMYKGIPIYTKEGKLTEAGKKIVNERRKEQAEQAGSESDKNARYINSIRISPSSSRDPVNPTIYFGGHENPLVDDYALIKATYKDGLCLYAFASQITPWEDYKEEEAYKRYLNPVTSIKLSPNGRVDINGDLYINNEKYEQVSLAGLIGIPELVVNNDKRIKALEDNTSKVSSSSTADLLKRIKDLEVSIPDLKGLKWEVADNQERVEALEGHVSRSSINIHDKIKELEENTSRASTIIEASKGNVSESSTGTTTTTDLENLKREVSKSQKKIEELEAFIRFFRKSSFPKSDRNTIAYIAGDNTTTFDFYE